jgi:hypothetical protein
MIFGFSFVSILQNKPMSFGLLKQYDVIDTLKSIPTKICILLINEELNFI